MSEYQHPTSEYARKVLDGEIVAGNFVRLACERHFSDLETAGERGIYFDEVAAQDALDFFPAMFTITDGAHAGKPFHLMGWHEFIVGSMFGWFKGDRLRFREAWIETGKGQAKSPLMGAMALYVCGFMGKKRAQCYAIASKLDQAKIPFKDAVGLCRADIPEKKESLESRGDVFISGKGENAWRISFLNGSFFEAKATTDSLSGPRPSCVIGDEIHEFTTEKPIELWSAGIAKNAGSAFMLMGTNTPALDQMVATDKSDYYQMLLEGKFDDDEAFAYIARVDEDDNPFEDEGCWIKSLPALGITFPKENIRGVINKAKNDAGRRLTASRLYFGIPLGSSGFWVDEDFWRACIKPVTERDIKDKKCYLSLDLSEKNDLTALGSVWQDEDDKLVARVWYWTTPAGLERRSAFDRIPYIQYVEKGELSITESPIVDYEFVAMQIKDLTAHHNVVSLTIDPSFWEKFRDACEKISLPVWVYEGPDKPQGDGLKVVRHSQGTRVAFGERNLCMPHSITRFSDKVLSEEIKIDANRVTQYCAANTVTKEDAIGNKMFIKSRQRGRIDGMVALAMAVGASGHSEKPKPPSVYERRALLLT